MGRTNICNPYIPKEYTEKHKITKRDLMQYDDFIRQAGIFFMNDEVAEEDKEKLFRDISGVVLESKRYEQEKIRKKEE